MSKEEEVLSQAQERVTKSLLEQAFNQDSNFEVRASQIVDAVLTTYKEAGYAMQLVEYTCTGCRHVCACQQNPNTCGYWD